MSSVWSIKRGRKKLQPVGSQSELRGALRLGVPQSLSEIALPALSALPVSFPNSRDHLLEQTTQRRPEKGKAGRHAGDGAGPAKLRRGYSGRLLCPLEVVPIVGRRLNLRASSLRECAERGLDFNPDGCSLRADILRELQSQGLRLKLNVESAGAQLQIALWRRGWDWVWCRGRRWPTARGGTRSRSSPPAIFSLRSHCG